MNRYENHKTSHGDRRAWLRLVLYLAATGFGYSWVIRHPWREPWVIPALPWEAGIVQQPAWAYVYATYLLLLPVLLFLRGGASGLGRVLGAGVMAQVGQLILDFGVPTRISQVEPAPLGTLLSWVQSLDSPLAAFPSGHVGMPMSLAIAAWLEMRRSRALQPLPRGAGDWGSMAALYFAWTALLALSALFTKQHGGYDVAGGLFFGAAMGSASGTMLRGLEACRHFLFVRPGWDGISMRALGREALGSMAALTVAVVVPQIGWKIAAYFILATRQHALLVLYHDAVHGLLSRSRRANDFAINAVVGIPMLLPVHLYRALHLLHHQALGSAKDPERTLLYHGQFWKYRPLATAPLVLQLLGDLLLWNNLIMVVRYFKLRGSGSRSGSASGAESGAGLALPKVRAYPEGVIQACVFWGLVVLLAKHWPAIVLQALGGWFITYATLTQALQKLRSFAEHARGDRLVDAGTSGHALSNSWQPGWLGRLTLWPYHIQYHREHHAMAHLPWHRLPEVEPLGERKPGGDFVGYLWRRA